MSTLGDRVTPRDLAALRERARPTKTAQVRGDAMATNNGWQVTRGIINVYGNPESVYERGCWRLELTWIRGGGHAKMATLRNTVTGEVVLPESRKFRDPATGKFDPMRRSQEVFRFMGYTLFNEALR